MNKSNNFSVNYDSSGLEIINKMGLVQFQLDLIEDVINLNGLFYSGDMIFVASKRLNIQSKSLENLGKMVNDLSDLERNFRHVGRDYIGKRSEIYLENKNNKLLRLKKIEEKAKEFRNMSNENLLEFGKSWISTFNEFVDENNRIREEEISRMLKEKDNKKNKNLKRFDHIRKQRTKYIIQTVSLKNELKRRVKDSNELRYKSNARYNSDQIFETNFLDKSITEYIKYLIDVLEKL